MTDHPRTCAALALAVVAGVTACGSSPAPAPTAAKKPAASAYKATYCAPLAAALNVKPVDWDPVKPGVMENYGKLLAPAANAASTARKTEVAEFLDTLSKLNLDPANNSGVRARASYAALDKIAPLISKDCGIKMRDYMKG